MLDPACELVAPPVKLFAVDQDRPLWQRIVAELREKIATGELAPGARLPSRPEIMRAYAVSDAVAKQVARVLIQEGLAEAHSGSGTYVREHRDPQKMVRAWHRSAPFDPTVDPEKRELTWEYRSRTVQAPADVRRRLLMPEPHGDEEDAVRTDYVRKANGEPVELSTSYEPLSLTRGTPIVLPQDGLLAGRGVAARMVSIGVVIDDWQEEVGVRIGTAEECAALRRPPGSYVLTIGRTHYAQDRPVETSDIVLPAERFLLVYGGKMPSPGGDGHPPTGRRAP
ncbi:GntR family transcriptional regulator [Actinomadura sp. ATCC 31491]|uniref:GntR family transcriptional regulator n=1 Tax=Actinomadura luzonensis TaxID=2805427 RepID=A0ABT0GAC5_9ACTN|nr:GntR family transcriptional regulator [Actinomadura luzonensis]MCK2221038.1 GntR family transcriptional regulator [Actinomadura luzonensis]